MRGLDPRRMKKKIKKKMKRGFGPRIRK